MPAHLELAQLLFEEEADYDLALQHFEAAWRYGDKDASANYLGWLHEQREDYAQARRYYQHSLRSGDGYAHWRLGRQYLHGLGGKADAGKARAHLQQACAEQYEDAYLDLAELLLGNEAEQEQALEWLRKALDAGVAGARERAEELLAQRRQPGPLARLLDRLRQ